MIDKVKSLTWNNQNAENMFEEELEIRLCSKEDPEPIFEVTVFDEGWEGRVQVIHIPVSTVGKLMAQYLLNYETAKTI